MWALRLSEQKSSPSDNDDLFLRATEQTSKVKNAVVHMGINSEARCTGSDGVASNGTRDCTFLETYTKPLGEKIPLENAYLVDIPQLGS